METNLLKLPEKQLSLSLWFLSTSSKSKYKHFEFFNREDNRIRKF